MARQRQKTVFNYFYCPSCGRLGYELPRPRGRQREKFHKKNLYCPHCKKTLNMIECKDDEEVFEFKEAFREGVFT